MSDRLDRLIADAAACTKCGKEHHPRPSDRPGRLIGGKVVPFADTWADPDDGHAYYRLLTIDVEWLRAWAKANPA